MSKWTDELKEPGTVMTLIIIVVGLFQIRTYRKALKEIAMLEDMYNASI